MSKIGGGGGGGGGGEAFEGIEPIKQDPGVPLRYRKFNHRPWQSFCWLREPGRISWLRLFVFKESPVSMGGWQTMESTKEGGTKNGHELVSGYGHGSSGNKMISLFEHVL